MEWYYVNRVTDLITITGKPYRSVQLLSATDTINATLFDQEVKMVSYQCSQLTITTGKYTNITEVNECISLEEFTSTYPTHPLLKVKFSSRYGLTDLLNLVKEVAEDAPSEMKEFLLSEDCTKAIESMNGFRAANKYHHTLVNGLISHTYEVCSLYMNIAKSGLFEINNPYVGFIAAVFHDIGKIYEYAIIPDWNIGHVAGSTMIVRDLLKQSNVDKPTSILIQHCILSHHGKKEFGSPIEPNCKEALLLNYCDLLSAGLDSFK